MKKTKPFWKTKTLTEMTLDEWESLCDGCGICCLYKIEDEETGQITLTNVACRFLDLESCTCTLYVNRRIAMPTCIKLTPSKVENLTWAAGNLRLSPGLAGQTAARLASPGERRSAIRPSSGRLG